VPDITFEFIRTGRPSRLGGKSEDLTGVSGSSTEPKAQVFDQAYLERLRSGDDETAKHFSRYFRRVVRAKVWGKFSRQVEEDLIDDVMAAAIENIMRGQPRDASYLPGYVCGICLNLMRQAMRPSRPGDDFVLLDPDRISDSAKTTEVRIEEREKAEAVSKILSTLSRRDREVLVDLFYHELSRQEISEKHGVTTGQLRLILFHASRRFRKKWKEALEEK
jgi:RNA polymerase sigma factor (sigma-70 family)